MPAPGDQHASWTNPFEEARPRVAGWAAKEIATIAAKLDKQLGPEYISSRAGPGGARVHYLTAEKCITLANEVFGFNGWSSSIQNIQVDFADENPQTQRVSIGLSVIVRVTLRDGTFHEDIGYGSIENAKGKAMAFEKAKKEGTTDGLKRALKSFGNVLGNCIYDQDYVKQVTKLKAQPVKRFDANNLHRHADFVKKELVKIEAPNTTASTTTSTTALALAKPVPSDSFEDFLGELDEADFCVQEDGHPDEIVIPTNGSNDKPPANMPPQAQHQAARSAPANNNYRQPQTPNQAQSRAAPQNGGQSHAQGPQSRNSNHATPTAQVSQVPQAGIVPESVGFFSARAVTQLPESIVQGSSETAPIVPQGQLLFNPKAESPSIRKTPGIDHTSSKPLSRSGQHVPPAASQSPAPATSAATVNSGSNGSSFTSVRPSVGGAGAGRGNMVNPSLDHARRIGAPGAPGSPLGNRGSYKPPSMKRPPLVDLPANGSGAAATEATDGLDAKRQKMA